MSHHLIKFVSRKGKHGEKTFKIHHDQTLLECLIKNKVEIDHTCGGNASCGTCRFYLLEGHLSAPNELEQEVREPKEFYENERLACQSYAESNIIISID